MKRRSLTILSVLYLFATVLAAIGAYVMAINQPASAIGLPLAPPRAHAPFAEMTENVWSCVQFGDRLGMRGNHLERVCGDGAAAGPERRPRRKASAPLRRAMAMAIAGDGARYEPRPSLFAPAAPANLLEIAQAGKERSAPPLATLIYQTGSSPLPIGAPSTGPIPGRPFVLVGGPGPQPFVPPTGQPPVGPPALVTPLPGAAPILLTGLAGLMAARRRARKARA